MFVWAGYRSFSETICHCKMKVNIVIKEDICTYTWPNGSGYGTDTWPNGSGYGAHVHCKSHVYSFLCRSCVHSFFFFLLCVWLVKKKAYKIISIIVTILNQLKICKGILLIHTPREILCHQNSEWWWEIFPQINQLFLKHLIISRKSE